MPCGMPRLRGWQDQKVSFGFLDEAVECHSDEAAISCLEGMDREAENSMMCVDWLPMLYQSKHQQSVFLDVFA
jgi:hypothetical protein